MTQLSMPNEQWYDAWRSAYDEFDGVHMDGSGYFGPPPPDPSRADFVRMVADRLAQADPSTPLDPGMVHCSFFWISEGPEVLGWLAIRHELNEHLLEQGGHIGYSIRPSRRRRGHAARALALAVVEARSLGIDRVLVTCDHDNVASRRTIERNGGVYEDTRQGKLRYWI